MAQQTLEFFDCKDNLEETLLIADPTVTCWKGRHAAHLPLAGGLIIENTHLNILPLHRAASVCASG